MCSREFGLFYFSIVSLVHISNYNTLRWGSTSHLSILIHPTLLYNQTIIIIIILFPCHSVLTFWFSFIHTRSFGRIICTFIILIIIIIIIALFLIWVQNLILLPFWLVLTSSSYFLLQITLHDITIKTSNLYQWNKFNFIPFKMKKSCIYRF